MDKKIVTSSSFFFFCLLIAEIATQHSNPDDTKKFPSIQQDFINCTNQNVSDRCSDSFICTYTLPNGCFLVPENKLTYTIDVQNESSILNLTLFPANVTEPLEGDVFVYITESAQTITWKLESGKTVGIKNYVSRTPRIKIRFTSEGKWSDLIFVYEEIRFEIHVHETETDTGTIRSYPPESDFTRPNTLTICQLNPQPRVWNESSVMVTVQTLQVDERAGDYLLIGAGKKPFEGSPTAVLTGSVTKSEKYYVAADNVYIVFFHTSQQPPQFLISWTRSGNRITEPEVIPDTTIPDSVLQAVPICFYNASWVQEFNYSEGESYFISQFQEKFADVANQYVKEKDIQFIQKIRPKSVQLVRVSSVIPSDERLPYGAIYAMLTIVHDYDSKLAIFRWYQVEEIVDKYDVQDGKRGHFFGFKIGNCPSGSNYKWWYVVTALILLLLTTFFIGVWMCAYNAVWKSKRFTKGDKVLSKRLSSLQRTNGKTAKNDYVTYNNPIITLTDEQGYSVHLNNGPITYTNVQSDEDSEAEVFNSNWIMKKRASRTELPKWEAIPAGQPHKFEMLKPEEKTGKPNLLWRADKIGESLPKETVKLEVHRDREIHSEELSSLREHNESLI